MKPGFINPSISSILAASLLGLASCQAAVTLYAEYHLGEAGSLGLANRPQDSSGNAKHYAAEIGGTATIVLTAGVSAPGSTAYLSTATVGNQGFFSDNLYSTAPALATNDFAFGIYARAASNTANPNGTRGDIFTLAGNVTGSFKLSLDSNGWGASINNVGFLGPAGGVVGSFTANQWVHLAVIRSAGTATLYINGIAQAGTNNANAVHGSTHLSMVFNNTANAAFDGHIDEARIVTFTPGETTTNILNKLTAVPEPSAALLGGLGLLMLLRRRRA